ncbi:MAG TPA: hypothetical protein VL098_03400 [Flavipsychrobacter sp.]|nr:hypothetical protein [Flavipsychrobacter sp.]
MRHFRYIVAGCGFFLLFSACKKWVDPNPSVDPRITERRYCNDPQAVNYNWDFPGTQDSSVCFFPSDLFEGNYSFTDSIYFQDNSLDTNRTFQTYTLNITRTSKNQFKLAGFCGGNDINFTAQRTTYLAYADTTLKLNDTTFAFGQPLCRIQDTLTGTLSKSKTDSLSRHIYIEWRVVSDSGINFHKGTAIKL